jgi:hypothetical protein
VPPTDGTVVTGAGGTAPSRDSHRQKQQNNMLLLNAMHTTAAHTRSTFAAAAAAVELAVVEAESDKDGEGAAMHAAETPTSSSATTPGGPLKVTTSIATLGATPTPATTQKMVPGGGKKKRKRELPLSFMVYTLTLIFSRRINGSITHLILQFVRIGFSVSNLVINLNAVRDRSEVEDRRRG